MVISEEIIENISNNIDIALFLINCPVTSRMEVCICLSEIVATHSCGIGALIDGLVNAV